jgi:MFS family permease
MVSGGTAGFMYNTAGIFLGPVSEEIGCSVTQLSMWFTFVGIAGAICLPFVGKALTKYNIRVLLTVCSAIILLAYGLMSVYTEYWMWWISGAVIGGAGAFVCFVPAPVILSQWFAKKTGLVIGIAMAMSGIIGAIFNPVLSLLIQNPEIGWRGAYQIAAIIGVIMVIPSTTLILRFKPADKGLKPYGYEEKPSIESGASTVGKSFEESGIAVGDALKNPSFYLLLIAFALLAVFTSLSQLFPSYAGSVEALGSTIGAAMVSIVMVANILLKLGFGAMADKMGALKAAAFSISLLVASYIFLYISTGNAIPAFIGAACFGVGPAFFSAGVPIVTRAIYGNKDYAKIYSYMMTAMALVGAFGLTVLSLLAGLLGGFSNLFLFSMGFTILILILIVVAFMSAKKIKTE